MNNILSDTWGIRLRHFVLNSVLQAVLPVWLILVASNAAFAAAAGCPPEGDTVARAMFTTQVENREPVDQVLILDDTHKEIYFFTDLRNLQGHEIVHRWEHDGKVVFQRSFSVKGPRWRVYSKQQLSDDMLGRWTVIVTDKGGCALKAVVFQYVRAKPDGDGSAIIKVN